VHDAPWEGSGSGYHSVFQDGDRYRMYYKAWHLDVSSGKMKSNAHPMFLCYAESDDGITWRRGDTNPVLGNRGAIAFITSISAAAAVDGTVRVYYDIAGNAAASSNVIAMRTATLEDL